MKGASRCERKPLRPALPVLLLPLLLCWAGVAGAAELAYRGCALSPAIAFSVAAPGALAVCRWIAKKRAVSLPLVLLLVFSLAAGTGSVSYGAIAAQAEWGASLNGPQELTIIDDTRHYTGSQGSEALAVSDNGEQIRVRVFWNDAGIRLPKGSAVSAHCTFTPLREDQRWLFDRGVVGTLSLSSIEDHGFADGLWGLVDGFRQRNAAELGGREGDGAALLAGVLLGYRGPLHGTAAEQDFTTCGLSHLIAVSGSHLAVVAALFSWCLRKLPIGRIGEVALLLAVLILYVMLTGLQPSAIRSAIMAGIAGCSVFVGRRNHAPSALTAAALVMLLAYPPNAYSLGFWLSVFAVLGITLFADLIAGWLNAAAPFGEARSPGTLSSALALTVAAATATMPLSVPTFAVLPLIGPVANLLVAPLITIALALGMAALIIASFFGPGGAVLLDLAVRTSDVAARAAAALAGLPWASIPAHIPMGTALAVFLALASLVYVTWPCPSPRTLRATGACMLVFFCVAFFVLPRPGQARLVVMDVGQGDALLIEEQGHSILIDTGASQSALVQALARNGVSALDAVIVTHLDDDHAGALGRLRGLVPVGRIYFARGILEHQAGNEAVKTAGGMVGSEGLGELSSGDSLRVGSTLALYTLWPETVAREGSNAESVCLLLQYDANEDGTTDQQVILAGDAEAAELQQILRSNRGLTAAAIKIGHHGSKNALTPEVLTELRSTVALISVGANNRYGHPAEESLETLAAYGVQTLRTDENGDISCIFRGNALEFCYATMMDELC